MILIWCVCLLIFHVIMMCSLYSATSTAEKERVAENYAMSFEKTAKLEFVSGHLHVQATAFLHSATLSKSELVGSKRTTPSDSDQPSLPTTTGAAAFPSTVVYETSLKRSGFNPDPGSFSFSIRSFKLYGAITCNELNLTIIFISTCSKPESRAVSACCVIGSCQGVAGGPVVSTIDGKVIGMLCAPFGSDSVCWVLVNKFVDDAVYSSYVLGTFP
jgi:hypothetical protein